MNMSELRLIDKIWQEMTDKNLLEPDDVTHLLLTKSSLSKLSLDYKEEFDQQSVTIDDLESYFGLSIGVVKTTNGSLYELTRKV